MLLMGHLAPAREPLHWHLTASRDSQPQPLPLQAVHQFLERQLRQGPRHAAGWPERGAHEGPWLFSQELSQKPPIANPDTGLGTGTNRVAGTNTGPGAGTVSRGEAATVGAGPVAVVGQQVASGGPKTAPLPSSQDEGRSDPAPQGLLRKGGPRKGARKCVCVCGGSSNGVRDKGFEDRGLAGLPDLIPDNATDATDTATTSGTTMDSTGNAISTVVCKKCSRLNDYALLLRWHKARTRGAKACGKTSSLFQLLGTVSVIGALVSYAVTWLR